MGCCALLKTASRRVGWGASSNVERLLASQGEAAAKNRRCKHNAEISATSSTPWLLALQVLIDRTSFASAPCGPLACPARPVRARGSARWAA